MYTLCGLSTAWASNHVPKSIDVAVSNSSNAALSWANFDELTAVQLNTDANQSSGLASVEFYFNTCEVRVDLIAANTNGGDLRLYAGGDHAWTTGSSLCSGGSCPARPDGLSTSNAGLLAAANSGAAGTVPGLWFFQPAACGGPTFAAGVSAGQFLVSTGPVGRIVDTEFVRVFGGGLEVGDLLVATESPSLIARVRAEHIAALLQHGTALPPADILVPASFFGSAKPAALAFVPGSSGVGSPVDGTSESEDLLVTVPPARVLKLNFGTTNYASAILQDFVFFTEGLGNGPLGAAAGTRGSETYMVVADRQRGQVVRVRLYLSPTGEVSLCPGGVQPCAAEIKIIKAGLQFPQGVAFNSNATPVGNCVGPDGCAIAGAIQLYLQEQQPGVAMTGPQQLDTNAIVIGQLYLVEDTRGTANTSLPLPPAVGAGFSLPAACRGFNLDDDSTTPPVVPVVTLTTDLVPVPGTIVQLQELLSGIFPQLENCDETGARIYHHPDAVNGVFGTPENGALIDKTVHCNNPSRGVNDVSLSPFAICSDLYYSLASVGSLSNPQQSALKAEVMGRIDRLETFVIVLPAVAPYAVLRASLLGKLGEVRSHLNRPRPTQAQYLAASAVLGAGAVEVVNMKATFSMDATLPVSSYGNLLTRWLALAFYTSETAATTPYCPPQTVRDVELPGVTCGN